MRGSGREHVNRPCLSVGACSFRCDVWQGRSREGRMSMSGKKDIRDGCFKNAIGHTKTIGVREVVCRTT